MVLVYIQTHEFSGVPLISSCKNFRRLCTIEEIMTALKIESKSWASFISILIGTQQWWKSSKLPTTYNIPVITPQVCRSTQYIEKPKLQRFRFNNREHVILRQQNMAYLLRQQNMAYLPKLSNQTLFVLFVLPCNNKIIIRRIFHFSGVYFFSKSYSFFDSHS